MNLIFLEIETFIGVTLMAPTVKIRHGNLFDGPSDLIVLPCATNGAVTGLVASSLEHHEIPYPTGNMELGDVKIMPFSGAENIAQYVAFAASVHRMRSDQSAIENIGRQIGEFTKNNESVRLISAPTLGAGAGGMSSEDSIQALKNGFLSSASPKATLIIHVLKRDSYDRAHQFNRTENISAQKIRVFISHTSIDEDSVEWVKKVALFLIENGIEARLDKFHLRRGMDLPQWMCNELALADKVIVVSDEIYKKKADGRLGGVGWETMIIQGDIAKLPPDSTKYQIIVRSNNIEDGIPMYLNTKYAFHAPHGNDVTSFGNELVVELLERPLDHRLDRSEFIIQ